MPAETITTLAGAIRAGLSCRCPRCGKGRLFQGFLMPRPMKGMMISLQYYHKAEERRFGGSGTP
jgi:uncharacterized protein (DUF983 family)